jgi:parallel beta-helix repeat protein
LEGNTAGVLLCYTNGSTVSGNVITNNLNGMKLEGSSNNVISDNRVAGNNECGIYLDGTSRDNNISDNRIESNGKDGVSVYAIGSSKGTMVSQNQITNNQGNGISVNGAQKCMIVGNNITLNRGAGICFVYDSSGNAVSGNYIAKNGLGIQLSNAVENTITLNTITENNGWGIELEGSQKNNVIHHNNFIDNNVTEGLQVRIAGVWSYPEFDAPFMNPSNQPSNHTQTEPFNEPEPPKFVAGAANAWDDGKEGNYWSDYTARYPNASVAGTSGVGNTPYFINENNTDHYPLMSPVAIHEIPTEPAAETSSQLPTNTTTPEQQQGSAEANLATQYALAAIAFSGIITVSMYLFLKHKKPTAKTK